MTRSRLLLAVASVLAGLGALFVVLGAVFNLLLAIVAVPFGLAAYLLWLHASGRLATRVSRRDARESRWAPGGTASRDARGGAARTRGPSERAAEPEGGPTMDRSEALAILGLSPGANQPEVRRAYRERAKAVHPDAKGGDEDAFRRVQAAYERLRRR